MAGTSIMVGIYTSPYSSLYPIEKVEDSPYPYPYPVNAGIPRQNRDGFGQYPRERVYLPSLTVRSDFVLRNLLSILSSVRFHLIMLLFKWDVT